jgi:hypothetical protein
MGSLSVKNASENYHAWAPLNFAIHLHIKLNLTMSLFKNDFFVYTFVSNVQVEDCAFNTVILETVKNNYNFYYVIP